MEIAQVMRQAIAIGILLLIVISSGCGGDHGGGSSGNTSTATSGTETGTLTTMVLTPSPGTTFIPDSTAFQLSWPSGTMPPPTFNVTLQEFFEPVSDGVDSEAAYVDAQNSTLTREGTSYVWDLTPGDGGLDDGGVYYVEVDAGVEKVTACYIVDGGRAQLVASRAAKAALKSSTKATAKTTATPKAAAKRSVAATNALLEKVHVVHRDL
jgi:hypothetical protein